MTRKASRLPNYEAIDLSAVDEDLIFVGSQAIKTTANGDIQLLPNGTGIVIIGDLGSTSHALSGNDSLFISNKLEVDGIIYADAQTYLNSTTYIKAGYWIYFGDTNKGGIGYNDYDTLSDPAMFAVPSTGQNLIITKSALISRAFDHAASSDPTIFIHSTTDPNTDNTQWGSLFHDQTDFNIETGTGDVNITPATGILNIGTDLVFSSTGMITTTSNNILTLMPNGTGYTRIGNTTATSHGLNSYDDFVVSGKLEVNGLSYFDDQVSLSATTSISPDVRLKFGSTYQSNMKYNTTSAGNGHLQIGLDITTCNMVICDLASGEYNFDHSDSSNPTLFIQAKVNPDINNTLWGSLYHDQTDFCIESGAGDITLDPASGFVNFKGISLGGSTVTHDDYVTLHVNGVAKKFMLGS